MKKIRISIFLMLALFLSLLAVSVGGAGSSTTFPKAKNKAEKELLTISEATLDAEADNVLLRFSFAVDREALATLEEDAKITFGALVGREANGFGKNTMKLVENETTGAFEAPVSAKMLTVYSTGGARPVNASFATDAMDAFTVTVDLETKTTERTESGIACLGFLIVEEEGEDARVLYVARNGSPYGSTPSFAGIVREKYFSDKENEEAMNEYRKLLQSQMKSDVDMFSNTRVFFCGEDDESDLDEGERAIWVEYRPEKDPYWDSADPDARAVRAAYIYYPLAFDPSGDYSASDLKEAGAIRVFAYIGVPETNDSVPGIVCVHGGGGHAYAKYALEAVKQGFAAIAFDTEGYHNTTGREKGSYSEGDNAYVNDQVGHKSKDNFASVEGALGDQWLYYAVSDTAIANTVLRAMSEVDEEKVGITGISWGGLVTTTAICYDHRFAFAAPVYISFHVAESHSAGVGGLKTNQFAADLWQDATLLSQSPVRTAIITSEFDHWASVDTSSKSAKDLPNGTLLIKPGMSHSQQVAAGLSEVYYYAYHILGENGGFITAKNAPVAESGRSYTLSLNIPEELTGPTATLYYRTEPFYPYGQADRPTFEKKELTVTEDGTVAVEIPADACMYFISFSGYSAEAAARKEGTPYLGSDAYKRGSVYSSTDIIFLP